MAQAPGLTSLRSARPENRTAAASAIAGLARGGGCLLFSNSRLMLPNDEVKDFYRLRINGVNWSFLWIMDKNWVELH